ncbi:MAG: energy coupling factor transporter S component ThiW [Synergistales bacterium]|nr:energy coupling factor transporter S component ThiW [Synergistales bacterium]
MKNPDAAAEKPAIRTVTLAGLLCAAAVLLSGFAVPVGPTRCFPFQHAVNAVAGVLLGPWWAAGAAFATSLIRNLLGTGTPFAFPGSIPGALAVGFAWKACRRDWAALAEPIGTGLIGALLSALIVAPALGKDVTLTVFIPAFLASSVPGAAIGLLVLTTLRRLGLRKDSSR